MRHKTRGTEKEVLNARNMQEEEVPNDLVLHFFAHFFFFHQKMKRERECKTVILKVDKLNRDNHVLNL